MWLVFKLGLVGAFLAVILTALDPFKSKCYIFDQNELHTIVKDAVTSSNDTVKRFEYIIDKVNAKWGKYILRPKNVESEENWIFNNAGGAMGTMLVLHASLTEYLIIFGTPIGTEGHTGRFWADDYFMIVAGEQHAYYANQFKKQVFKPGDMHWLKAGTSQGYKIPDTGGWALEYARGYIPLMLPFGFADGILSTLDFVSLARTLYVYAQGGIINALQGKF
eukprot:TRINITY_DN64559_c0_g1_i4.p1 TRINITY_DN64559_c0_g1~~TRINITY_DN64559_c0_g1_i4.p1  ORF type:complete len:221 (+),score=42.41 TRINITY_DN64559_c0_g1_i4:2-664(+)